VMGVRHHSIPQSGARSARRAAIGPASETLPVSGHTTTPAGAAQFDPSRSESAHRKVPKADA
jgi:hypothetical protein